MGDPINPNVRILFDDQTTKAAVTALDIDPDNLFFFAYAETDPGADCAQLKQVVLAKTEDDFDYLAPLAHDAGRLPVPTKVVDFINPPKDPKVRETVFLDDCCVFSRNVQVFALAPAANPGDPPRTQQWDAQSVVVLQDDRNPDKKKRRVNRLHITPLDIRKDCSQL